tara:strand:+ start:257 stop:433 length:177 start_codon:yes stop_codon:yes gene_type:complete
MFLTPSLSPATRHQGFFTLVETGTPPIWFSTADRERPVDASNMRRFGRKATVPGNYAA